MWLLQTLNYKYETDVAFRVNVNGLPADVELDRNDTYLTVRVRDYGTELIGYEFRGAVPLEVDYAELSYSNGSLVLPLSVAKQKIEGVVESSTSIVRLLQDTVLIDVKRNMALLPVNFDGVIDVADHFMVTDVEIVPSEVNVYATAASLEKISEVRTEYLVKKYLKSSVCFKAKLAADELMTIDPGVVDVFVTVKPLVEKKLNVPVEYIGFPSGYAGARPGEVELTIEVPEPDAPYIEPKDFKVSVDYNEAVASGDGCATFSVMPSSHKVKNIRVNPSQIIIR